MKLLSVKRRRRPAQRRRASRISQRPAPQASGLPQLRAASPSLTRVTHATQGRRPFSSRHWARAWGVGCAWQRATASFTLPDAYLFTVLRWTAYQQIDLARWPNIVAYMTRVGERPKVKEALQAEGLLKAAA